MADVFDHMAATDPQLQGAQQAAQQPHGDVFDHMAANDPHLQGQPAAPQQQRQPSPPPAQGNPVADTFKNVRNAAYQLPGGVGEGFQSMGQLFNNANKVGPEFFQAFKSGNPDAMGRQVASVGGGLVQGAAQSAEALGGLAGMGNEGVARLGDAYHKYVDEKNPSQRISELNKRAFPNSPATTATADAAGQLMGVPGFLSAAEEGAMALLMRNPTFRKAAEFVSQHPNALTHVGTQAAKGAAAGAGYNAALGAGGRAATGQPQSLEATGKDIGAGATMGTAAGAALSPFAPRPRKPETQGPPRPKTEADAVRPENQMYNKGGGSPGFDYWHPPEPAKPPVKGGVPAVIPKKTELSRIVKQEAPTEPSDVYTVPPQDVRIIKPTKEIESGQPTGPKRIGMDRPGQEPPRESYYHETRPSYIPQRGPQYGSEPTPEQIQSAEQRRTAGEPWQAWRGQEQRGQEGPKGAMPPAARAPEAPPEPRKLTEVVKQPEPAAPEAPAFKDARAAMDVLNSSKDPAQLDAAQKYLEDSFAARAQPKPKPKLSEVVRPEQPAQQDFAPPKEEPPVMQPEDFKPTVQGEEPKSPGEQAGEQAAEALYSKMGMQKPPSYKHEEKERVPIEDVTERDRKTPFDYSNPEPRPGVWNGKYHAIEPHPYAEGHVTVGPQIGTFEKGLKEKKKLDDTMDRMRRRVTVGQILRDAGEQGLTEPQRWAAENQLGRNIPPDQRAILEKALERDKRGPQPEYNKPTRKAGDPAAEYEHGRQLQGEEKQKYPNAFDVFPTYEPGMMKSPPNGEVAARNMSTGELKHSIDRILAEAKKNKTSGVHGDEVNPHRLSANSTDFKYWKSFTDELKRRGDRELNGETKDWPSEDGYHEPVDYSKVSDRELEQHVNKGTEANQQAATEELIRRQKGEAELKRFKAALEGENASSGPKKLSDLKAGGAPVLNSLRNFIANESGSGAADLPLAAISSLAKFAGKTPGSAVRMFFGKKTGETVIQAVKDFAKMNNTLDNIKEGAERHGDDIDRKLIRNLGSEAHFTRGLNMEGKFGQEARDAIRHEHPATILNPENHKNWTPEQREAVAARKAHRIKNIEMINDVLNKHGDTIDPKYAKALKEYKEGQYGYKGAEPGSLERGINDMTSNLYNSFFRWNPAFHALIATHPLQMGTAVAGVHNIATAYHQLVSNASMRKLYGEMGEVTQDPRQQMADESRQRQAEEDALGRFANKPLAKPLAKDLPTARINSNVIHLGGMLKKANELSKGNGLEMVQKLADGTLPKDQAIELHTAGVEALIDATGGGSFGMNRNYLQSSPVFKYFAQLSGYKSVVARYNSKLARGMADGIKSGDMRKAGQAFASFATLTGATILLGGHAVIPKEAEEPLAKILGPDNLYGLESALDMLNMPKKIGIDLTNHLQYSALNYGENAINQSIATVGRDIYKMIRMDEQQDKTPAEIVTDALGHVLMMSRFSSPGGIGMSTIMRAKQSAMDLERGYKKLNIYSKDWMSPNPFADEKHMAAVNTGDLLYKMFAPGVETREGNVEQRVKFNKYFKKHSTEDTNIPDMEEAYPVADRGIDQPYQ